MKLVICIFAISMILLSFYQYDGNLQYIDTDSKVVYSIQRTKISDTEFRDEKNTLLLNDTALVMSADTFKVQGKNWFIKEFGKFHLFLGPESFKKDSVLIHLNLVAKRSNLGFWNDTQTVYPYSYVYRPVRKIRINSNKAVYVYEEYYYTYQILDDIATSTIFFDPEIGVVKTFNLTTGIVILKGYQYLDSLKLE